MSAIEIFHESFLLPILLLLLPFFFVYKWMSPKFTPNKNLPPSPPKLPIIGNLHQLGSLTFRSLQTLSETYGDLMLLHLGSKPTIVVSSSELASEVLKNHDLVFAGRPSLSIFKKLLGDGKNMISSPYGEYWRQMRSVCMLQVLSNKRVRSYRRVREEEVGLMIENIKAQRVVDLSGMFMSLSNDLINRVALGKKYRKEESEIDFEEVFDSLIKLLGGYYIGDFISWLGWINKINGVDAEVNSVAGKLDRFLEGTLQDHLNCATKRNGEEDGKMKSFVDVLLEAQTNDTSEYPLLDRKSIKCLIQDIIGGGTETTAIVLEWTMSELLKNPRVMQELQKEVSRITGEKEMVSEDDIENMNYLKAVLKETLHDYILQLQC